MLEQAADIPDVGEGGDPRGDPTEALLFGELEGSAEFEEGVAAEDRADEGAVGDEKGVDLGEDRGEVVNPVHGERGDYGGEGGGGEVSGEGFFIEDGAGDGGAVGAGWWEAIGDGGDVPVKEGVRKIGADELGDLGSEGSGVFGGGLRFGQRAGNVTGTSTEIKHFGEGALYILDLNHYSISFPSRM